MRSVGWAAPSVAVLLSLAGCLPKSDDLNQIRAVNAMAQDRADWARTYYAADRLQHPERLESLLGEALAWSSGYQRSRAKTRELLHQYLLERPEDQDALVRYLNELLVVREMAEAERWLEFLNSSDTSSLIKARVVASNQPERALELVEDVVGRSPETASAWALKAELEERLGQIDLCVSSAQQALALEPFQYSTVYLLARGYRRLGRDAAADQALLVHEIVAELEADGTRKAVTAVEELELLRRLQPLVDDQGGAFQARMMAALFKAGKVTEAIEMAEREIGENPHTVAELASLAVLADGAGARALATRLFKEISQLQPDHVGAQASLIVIDLEAGRLDEARQRLESAIADHPDFARLEFLRGRLALAEGGSERAVEAFERALLLAPWEWSWRITLADLYKARGNRKSFKRVVDEAPEAPPGWQEWLARHHKTVEAN